MTESNFRSLCQELMDAIDSGIPRGRIKQSPLAVRVDAALAQPEPQGLMPEVDDILRLAAIIRRVDGNHDKGAAALAEAILSHPDSRWQHAQPEPQGPTGRPTIEPVPVSDPPGPEDCDAEGRCWWFSPPACGPNTIRPCWTFDSETLEGDTHWLPHWALPVPAPANTINQED
jgi:hypothetical protein